MTDKRYYHIVIPGPTDVVKYIYPGATKTKDVPRRDRQTHGHFLKSQIANALNKCDSNAIDVSCTQNGIYLEFQSDAGFDSNLKSLEDLRQGIRLCNVREYSQSMHGTITPLSPMYSQPDENASPLICPITSDLSDIKTTLATVYIPNDRRNYFVEKIDEYLTQQTEKGMPKNNPLISKIDNIRNAVLVQSFWTDEPSLMPGVEAVWCEIWLRSSFDEANKSEALNEEINSYFRLNEMAFKDGYIDFPERMVKLACLNNDQLALLTKNCDVVAEYRRAKETASFLLNLPPKDQADWVSDLITRLQPVANPSVSICILDTGVNYGHPLISPVLAPADCLSVDPAWQTHDHHKHGTLMAGIAAYGNLQYALENANPIYLRHALESVAIYRLNS